MRITTGSAKGHKIIVPAGREVRPTKDIVRQAVFSILGNQIEGLNILDIYAGSGSLGLEALSRGAEHVDFVDASEKSIEAIENNLAKMNFQERGESYHMKFEHYLRFAKEGNYDVIFADPPYQQPNLARLAEELAALLSPGGVLVLEYGRDEELMADKLKSIQILDTRKYGASKIAFLQKPHE